MSILEYYEAWPDRLRRLDLQEGTNAMNGTRHGSATVEFPSDREVLVTRQFDAGRLTSCSCVAAMSSTWFPHLDNENMPDFSMTGAEEWAAGLPGPGYAIDDQTAIKVTGGTVDVVSEGHWKLFTPPLRRPVTEREGR
jgi:hypothetical protein